LILCWKISNAGARYRIDGIIAIHLLRMGQEWDVLDTYFQSHMYPYTKHHIDSFHTMFGTNIPNTIRSFNPITMLKQDTNKNETFRVEVWIGSPYDADRMNRREREKDIAGERDRGIYVDRPTRLDENGESVLMTPQHARLRNLTYATKLYADITVKYFAEGKKEPIGTKTFPYTILGRIPIMLHSDQCILHNQGSAVLRGLGECPMDPGGYFIVDGKEKVIVSQERITTNRLFVSKIEDKYFSHRGYIHCTGATGETALSPRSVDFVLVKRREPPLNMGNVDGIDMENKKKNKTKGKGKDGEANDADADAEDDADGNADDDGDVAPGGNDMLKKIPGAILVSLPSIHGRLPLTTVFRALGITSDKDIVEAICGGSSIDTVPLAFLNFLRPSIAHCGPIDSKGTMHPVYTTKEALGVMADRTHFKSLDVLKAQIATDMFPNVEGGNANKAKFLAYLVSVFMRTALGVIPDSERDGYVFKRVNVSGKLLSERFQEIYTTFRNKVRDLLDHDYHYKWHEYDVKDIADGMITNDNLHKMFPSTVITENFQRSLKGMWGSSDDDPEQGIVQDLSRISYIGALSHLRRVDNDLDRSLKITAPHRLHSQQWGVMCPFETPDGASVGYLKNFALLTQITSGTNPTDVIEALQIIDKTQSASSLPPILLSAPGTVRVFINGSLMGITTDPVYVTRAIRLFRRNGLLNPFVSVAWNIIDNEVRINTDSGRPCRPLLILVPSKEKEKEKEKTILAYERHKTFKKVKWDDLIYGGLTRTDQSTAGFLSPYSMHQFEGKDNLDMILDELERTQACIEYLDIEEENTMLIAMNPSDLAKSQMYTHVEIHPTTALSVVTNIVPFANHNQAPRVYFHGSQSKQAVGIYTTNWNDRFDTAGYIQHYPQRRIVGTRGSHYNGNNKMPNGANVVVAIMTHTGFNQEDSVMINRAAIDRGLFQCTVYKSVTASEKVVSATEKVSFTNPVKLRDSGKPVSGIKHANYTLIDDNGFIGTEAYIPKGQDAVVLGMVHCTDTTVLERRGVFMDTVTKTLYKDISLRTSINHYGTIDRVFVGTTVPGNPERICKIRYRKVRRPEPGNKFCSAHGQKGVVGMIIPEENMPFTKDGIRPDIIINPHAFPSRMTMGHLLETVFAKLCCLKGCLGDGTVFIPFDKEKAFEELALHGFDRHGNEILYDGRCGHQIETEVFIGPILYYSLKHMVVDKMQSRGSGPKEPRAQLTHQPAAGRSQGGGLRIGEMERDVLIGHGMANLIKEFMMEKADKYQWAVCRHCGTVATYNLSRSIIGCGGCGLADVAIINTPYSMKLLIQELEAMGIQMRLSVDCADDEADDNDHRQHGGEGGDEEEEEPEGDEEEEDEEEEEEEGEDEEAEGEEAEAEEEEEAEGEEDVAEEEEEEADQEGGEPIVPAAQGQLGAGVLQNQVTPQQVFIIQAPNQGGAVAVPLQVPVQAPYNPVPGFETVPSAAAPALVQNPLPQVPQLVAHPALGGGGEIKTIEIDDTVSPSNGGGGRGRGGGGDIDGEEKEFDGDDDFFT
jgi:DNA-directed RNA polymerase II subunit RPB2